MIFLLLLLAADANYGDYRLLRHYESLEARSTEILRLPFALDFSPKGELFVLDTVGFRVHVWDEAGNYRTSFGSKGAGPGELAIPGWLRTVGDQVWVWGFDRCLSKFDASGTLIATEKTAVRFDNFLALTSERCVAAYKSHTNPRQTFASFQLTDGAGTPLALLLEFPNESYLSPPGDSVNRVKAFPPDHVIQPADEGHAWLGFSQNNLLYLVDSDGTVRDKRVFELPGEPLNDEDLALVRHLCYPLRTGGTGCLEESGNLILETSHDKALYTDFIIRGGRVAFVLTPLGGMRSGSGFCRASFRVNDLASGKPLARGRYAFPENSILLHQRGRSIAFALDQDGDYQVQEILLDGLEQ